MFLVVISMKLPLQIIWMFRYDDYTCLHQDVIATHVLVWIYLYLFKYIYIYTYMYFPTRPIFRGDLMLVSGRVPFGVGA